MQLVSGEISIESHSGSGTTIYARVPFRGIAPFRALGKEHPIWCSKLANSLFQWNEQLNAVRRFVGG